MESNDLTVLGFNSRKHNTVALLELLDKYIEINLIKDCNITGFVHSVDPVTHSIILSVPHGDLFHPTLIPGHAILDAKERTPPANITSPARMTVKLDTEVNVSERKIKLITWLKFNLLPITESSDSKIRVGNAYVLPPYTVADICTDNPIVALQIRKLIENMPADIEPNEELIK